VELTSRLGQVVLLPIRLMAIQTVCTVREVRKVREVRMVREALTCLTLDRRVFASFALSMLVGVLFILQDAIPLTTSSRRLAVCSLAAIIALAQVVLLFRSSE
jgi:hypothetical protein